MEVVSYDPKEPQSFVALSHVWADGLGNPHAMRLLHCQVSRLRNLVEELQAVTRTEDPDARSRWNPELYLWCDTLCCPIEAPHKGKALDKLVDVYRSATNVLVLDQSIEKFRYAELDPLEAGARLATSRWTQRLWTFIGQPCSNSFQRPSS